VSGEFTSGVATDWAHIWTRSSGQPGAGFQLDSGVELIIKPAELEARLDGARLASLAFDGGLAVGQPVVFDIFDDGAQVSLTVRNKGADNEARLSVAAPGATLRGKVVFGTGNEAAPVTGRSGFGLLRVEHGVRVKPTREWTFEEVAGGSAGQIVGGYGALPDGGLAGGRLARFVNGQTPAVQAPPVVTPGVFGVGAAFFNQSGGRFLELPNDIIGSTGGDFSVSFWYRGAFTNTGVTEIFGNRSEGSGGRFFCVRASAAGIGSEIDQSPTPGSYSPIGPLPVATSTDERWRHVVVTRGGTNHQLFVDGQLAGRFDGGVIADFGKTTPFWVGRGFGVGGSGSFDELRVYDAVALDACEVRRLSERPPATPPCGAGQALCAGAAALGPTCVDLQRDAAHCGGCGVACTVPAGATATCQTGACGFRCQPGFLDCNGQPGDGCEAAGTSCGNAPVLVSVGVDGGAGNGPSFSAVVDNSGQFVVFTSSASNLVLDDTNNVDDVFLRNVATGQTTRISTGPAGEQLAGGGFGGTISGDGRFVAFLTTGPAIVPDTNGAGTDLILVDRVTNQRSYGMTSSMGAQPGGNTEPFLGAFLSTDGRVVMQSTRASGLFSGDTVQNESDIYVSDRRPPIQTRMASLTVGGAVVTGGANGFNAASQFISGQGRYVTYNTFGAVGFAASGSCSHAYLVDMSTSIPTVVRVERDNGGGVLTCDFQEASAAGLLVNEAASFFAFQTRSDLPAATLRSDWNIYRRPTVNGASTLVTQAAGGGFGNGNSFTTSINEQGTRLSFVSTATNLDADSNGTRQDCFVWSAPASLSNLSQPVVRVTTAPQACSAIILSRTGQWAALVMNDALSPSDLNSHADVYLRPVR
ncbi:MAG: hypothetical protein INH37_00660, partial [Myxococcaceae bacterium]|nr:hypothetical protein [Myxococcaceae bacterium]